MGGFFESFLRVAMIVLIVGPVTAWVARVGAKERGDANESTERFTVRMPRAPRLLMAGCAVAFEVIMLVPYIWQGLSLGIWDHQLVWLGHGLALAALAVLALFSMPRIDVDGEEISARNIVGMRKRTTFDHITAATLHTQMMSIALYTEQGKFSSVSLEGVCSSNLLIRLAEEGIEVADAVQAPMTKASLCWAAIKPLTIVFLGMAAVFSLVLIFMVVFANVGIAVLAMVPFLFILLGAVLPLCMLSMPLRGVLLIGRQERELGFCFAREMAAHGVTGTELEDEDWFVSISNARIVAFRRDYIKKISAVEDSDSGNRCMLTAKSGRKHKVYAAGSTLDDLRTWFRRGARKRTMTERAQDALETIG